MLNLLVQDGIDAIADVTQKVRETVKYVTLNPSRLDRFNNVVRDLGLPTHKGLILDIVTRWNSTFHMLSRALVFKSAFPVYKARDPCYDLLPSDDDWERAYEICKFLEIFNDTTRLFSGVNYPTSNLFFSEVWKIRKILDDMTSDTRPYMVLLVSKMREKFDKYWGEVNLLMAVGAVLDPRNKLKYLEFAFGKLYPTKKFPAPRGEKDPKCVKEVKRVSSELFELYADYIAKGDLENSGIGSNSNRDGLENSRAKDKIRSEFENWAKEMTIAQPSRNELDVYLEESIFLCGDDQFDALNWWKANSLKFPNLSKMARDILSIPVSTVASESTFSAAGRVIDEHRSSLLPDTVEALICAADWLRHEFGIGTKVKVFLCLISIFVLMFNQLSLYTLL